MKLLFLSMSLFFFMFSCASQTIIKTAPSRSGSVKNTEKIKQSQPFQDRTKPEMNSTAVAPPKNQDSATTEALPLESVAVTPADPVKFIQPEPPAPAPMPQSTLIHPKPQQTFEFLPAKTTDKTKSFSNDKFAVNSKKIGVILPITGKNSNLSASVLSSIRMGLGMSDEQPGAFSIAIYDSQGVPETAAAGVEKLLRDENVVAILGGLSSKEAQAISDQADFFRVPFITFSQKSGLTENTQYTFRNAITSEMQIKRIVEYAYSVLGARRFGILYPNDAYGVEFANHFWDHVLARGGTSITAAQVYDPKETDLSIPVKKLIGTHYVEARGDEYKDRKKEIAEKLKKKQENELEKNKKSLRENETKENVLAPVIDFDILFLPDSSRALGQAMAFLKSSDVGELTFMGTNLWNSSELFRRVGTHQSQKLYFVDAYNSPDMIAQSAFVQKFVALTQQQPTLLDAQTFEASVILKDLLAGSNLGRESLADRLSSLGRRPGAHSEVIMSPLRELERPLSILTLDQGQIKKVD